MSIEINAMEIIETILTAWYFSSFLHNGPALSHLSPVARCHVQPLSRFSEIFKTYFVVYALEKKDEVL